ncbi:hypothetical protein BWQ96_02771 [Gracilariopsis chorda]|uniref:CWH43-like N-terminal domain-containing protein n=1 Tax=Gracilariopsis chorda TaxID=448386 RepID=A0A2V3J224_9FLOR|nr:hypothetical protein BWQ96_02771 [Gracilariopsis chorda]|eukprot:PXF47440.1 hypothetical protein BWQ96_02771 [Gracilariopsis chorda]
MLTISGSNEPFPRRRFSRWAALHAWKLAGLTALVTFVGVFIAVSLSLVLRPTRSYFFPLFSDVSKHQPEAAILRLAFVVATTLLFATATASVQHCRALQFFSTDSHPLPHTPTDHVHLSDDDLSTIATKAATPKRRLSTFSIPHLLLFALTATLLTLAVLQYLGVTNFPTPTIRRVHLLKLGLYLFCTTWLFAMCFLIWYFLKLQHMPNRVHPDLPLQLGEGTESSTPRTHTLPNTPANRVAQRLRTWATHLIVILRPICLTGQAVCVIKIVGLWFALDSFSISKIKLVKLALLAALAFAEYTATFFFAFFMTILAVDMRSKASTPDLLLYA